MVEEGCYAFPVRCISVTYNWAVRMAWRLLGASGDTWCFKPVDLGECQGIASNVITTWPVINRWGKTKQRHNHMTSST